MRQTELGPGGFWGLTLINAHDEMLLLKLLTSRNSVLTSKSRDYVLALMARVVSSQRWGVTAGAPDDVTVHVKNGWLPLQTHGWRINSLGSFSGHGRDYMVVMLTMDNPTMAYGIDTIQGAAEVINRELNPGVTNIVPPASPAPVVGHARRAGPARSHYWAAPLSAAARAQTAGRAHATPAGGSGRRTATADDAAARAAFPDWRFAPNAGGRPDVYEIENRALDPSGHLLAAMRGLAPWDGRRLVDLGCGTGFWLPGYAGDAARVIGMSLTLLRARAADRIRDLPHAEVIPGSAERLPLPDRSVDVVHARFAYFLSPGIVAGSEPRTRV